MIAKIVKGSSFRGVVGYILDKEKDAKILVCDGLFAEDKDTIAMSFEAQSKMNPKVMKPVGHISLAFHKEDEHRLTDRAMAGIALEYLKKMGITDTQILIVRHYDKEHPHVHIAFNRIANNGRTISDRNERIRSMRVCKELTRKYGLYFANGKEQVKRHRLKEPDKTKYELYSYLKRKFQGVETGICLSLIWRNKAWKYGSSTREIRTRCRVSYSPRTAIRSAVPRLTGGSATPR